MFLSFVFSFLFLTFSFYYVLPHSLFLLPAIISLKRGDTCTEKLLIVAGTFQSRLSELLSNQNHNKIPTTHPVTSVIDYFTTFSKYGFFSQQGKNGYLWFPKSINLKCFGEMRIKG